MLGYSPYEAQFMEARDFARGIFAGQVPQALQVISTEQSYYVDHGINHVERVIDKLDTLTGFLSNVINRKEVFILLVAAYYHDIGMFLGRRESEDPEQTRREHHRRSAEVIQMLNDRDFLHIQPEELDIIKKVIEAHRAIDLQGFPESQRIAGDEIRTQLLGALLRIADSCDCDRSRAPRAIYDLFYEHIPERSRKFWEAHFPVTDVTFENSRASIVVSINFAGDLYERIEKHRMGSLLKRKLEEELHSVEAVFRHNTISLARVEIKDFGSGRFVNFSFPPHGSVAIVAFCSDFEKVDDLIGIVSAFVSNALEGTLLVVELRPPEGPLFIDTEVYIDGNRLEEIKSTLQQKFGSDLWGVKGEVVEMMTIRRG